MKLETHAISEGDLSVASVASLVTPAAFVGSPRARTEFSLEMTSGTRPTPAAGL